MRTVTSPADLLQLGDRDRERDRQRRPGDAGVGELDLEAGVRGGPGVGGADAEEPEQAGQDEQQEGDEHRRTDQHPPSAPLDVGVALGQGPGGFGHCVRL